MSLSKDLQRPRIVIAGGLGFCFLVFWFWSLLYVLYDYLVLEQKLRIHGEIDTEVQGGGENGEIFTGLPNRGPEWPSWMQHGGSRSSQWEEPMGPFLVSP